MQQYIVRRLLLFIPTLLFVSLVVFVFMRIIPGDPAVLILIGDGTGVYTQEQLESLQRELGTDRPIHEEYGIWLWDLFHGDLGESYTYGTPVVDHLKSRMPLTLELAALAMLMSFMVAVPLGMISAIMQDTIPDYIARVLSFIGIAIPNFVTGLLMVYLLVELFNWIPPLGYADPWDDLGKNLQQMVFPSIAIAIFMTSIIARVTRSSMLEVLRQDYIRTARSKGLGNARVWFIHALQNASLPILTVTGWSFAVLLGGTVVVEKIFILPGMGTFLIDSISSRDYPAIQALVLVVGAMILSLNLVIDLLYGWLDPRIRLK